jgi:hypothetical protein
MLDGGRRLVIRGLKPAKGGQYIRQGNVFPDISP